MGNCDHAKSSRLRRRQAEGALCRCLGDREDHADAVDTELPPEKAIAERAARAPCRESAHVTSARFWRALLSELFFEPFEGRFLVVGSRPSQRRKQLASALSSWAYIARTFVAQRAQRTKIARIIGSTV